VLQTIVAPSGDAGIQYQRIAQAEARLADLDGAEALIRLNNRWLARHVEDSLRARIVSQPHYTLRRLGVKFGRQAGLLEASLDIGDGQGNVISANLKGEVLLDYNGAALEWLPLLHEFEITSRDFVFADGNYAQPLPDLTGQLDQQFHISVLQALIDEGVNQIHLEAVPLADVSVGLSLPGFSTAPAVASSGLRGVFMVAGSATLIESQATTIALDMTFIPDLSACPADVTVSRAGFVREVKDREPVGMARKVDDITDIDYFYSEIAGAKEQLAIIHYWFADGEPMAVEELPVGPSYRWRTWSGRGSAGQGAKRWEVLVVEKESGCILHAQALRAPEPAMQPGMADPTEVREAFDTLTEGFTSRVAGFAITADKPEIALVEVDRAFYGGVLQSAMADLRIDARFDDSSLQALQLDANLQALDVTDVRCEHRDCPSLPVCKANLAQCKRLRDTRDCSYCQFRNPLNNRCISEVLDPLCEASRKRLNDKYEADRAACIADAEAQKRECDELAAQIQRSCELEAGRQDSACNEVKDHMAELGPGASLARIRAHSNLRGELVASFTNFTLGKELELDMRLLPRSRLEGEIGFRSASRTGPLTDCISDWSGPFRVRLDAAPDANRLLTGITETDNSLAAQWSGFGLTLAMRPSPIRAIFAGRPQLLANCGIGLTPDRVEQAVVGEHADFFNGSLELLIQPLPTVIRLAPSTLDAGKVTYNAAPRLYRQTLRYEFTE
jgi:hypothetical protein